MTWNNYTVTFKTSLGSEGVSCEHCSHGLTKCFCAPGPHEITRYIRATSVADAKYRVIRKFILPEDAEIIGVKRVN